MKLIENESSTDNSIETAVNYTKLHGLFLVVRDA